MHELPIHHAVCRLLTALFVFFCAPWTEANPTTFDYCLTGVQLEDSPAALAVPKRIAGSLNVRLSPGADGVSADLGDGAWVEGTLRGPSFAARRVVGRLGARASRLCRLAVLPTVWTDAVGTTASRHRQDGCVPVFQHAPDQT